MYPSIPAGGSKEILMSQQEQEFVQRQQSPQNEDESYNPRSPYHWSGSVHREGVPRDEPPSSYNLDASSDYEAGYQAQDVPPAAPQMEAQQQLSKPQAHYNPYDGDAYEQSYRPYATQTPYQTNAGQQGVPPWARPQQRPGGRWRFGPVLLILILIASMQGFFGRDGFMFWGVGHVFGILVSIAFWIFLSLLFIVPMLVFGAIRPRRRGWRRRGPWSGW